jgi:2-polyprenyl-3-methyl-5-hydroxy-6-metoxy-1,4-benzoquinol methylase
MILDKIIYQLRTGVITKNIKKDTIICDLGCRKSAFFLKKISSIIKYGYGFDIDAENYKDPKIETKKINFNSDKIPLENESVDCVIMAAVLEHLNNPENIIKESHRILKKGGMFLLTTPSVYSKPILEFLALKLKVINKEDILEHKKYYKPSEIIELFVECGFDKKNIKYKYFELFFNILIITTK